GTERASPFLNSTAATPRPRSIFVKQHRFAACRGERRCFLCNYSVFCLFCNLSDNTSLPVREVCMQAFPLKAILFALFLALLFLQAPCAHAWGEADYERWYKECPSFREMNDQLNLSWKKLKSLCDTERYQKELAEQRAWLKNRSSLIDRARRVGEDPGEACARVFFARTALLNAKIEKLDPSWITFSIQRNVRIPDFKGNDTIADLAIAPSRPVLMNWFYTVIDNKAAAPWHIVESLLHDQYLWYEKKLAEINYEGARVTRCSLIDYFDTGDEESLSEESAQVTDITSSYCFDKYNVVYSNGTIVCVTSSGISSIGLRPGRAWWSLGKTKYFKTDTGASLSVDDLFVYPQAARDMIKGIAYQRMMAALSKKFRAEPDWKLDREMLDRLVGLIGEFDMETLYIKNQAVCLDFSDYSLRFTDDIETYLGVPLVISAREIELAIPLPEYFGR
ncbi:MAG: hypothetical protein Q4F72_12935, partial [Desulfovibrionaceae bacterium]|nr:hypothetical protein [Desulfovibrionaceae bacterium]